jgi:2-C-methyl-D-erythritol 4-phosphate cytidylyltransferase/2-C-methyl-D-erythritol 2,4-cyclodiphosphate synthase
MTVRAAAVIVAGGSGERFGRAGGKQTAPLGGKPMLAWSVAALDATPEISHIVVVCPPGREVEFRSAAIVDRVTRAAVSFAESGATRQESVAAGLAVLPVGLDAVAVHDGARPLVSPEFVSALFAKLAETGADGVVPGHPSVDTLKVVSADRIAETPDRSRLWAVQTPQVFQVEALRDAYARAAADGFLGTDDASLVERAGGDVRVLEGPRDNIKLTLPEDVAFAEAALSRRGQGGSMTRIGIGYDVHAFAPGRRLVLGGVEIEHEFGLAGHSDADVLAHAVADAVLGALRAGDIGKLFPDTDPAYAGADSIALLREVAGLAAQSGWTVADADCVLVLEAPKIAPYREAMRENLAGALGVPVDAVGVKATTTEGLGFEGRREGVAAQAVVLLARAGA